MRKTLRTIQASSSREPAGGGSSLRDTGGHTSVSGGPGSTLCVIVPAAQPPPPRPPPPPTHVYLLLLSDSRSCCGNASRVFNPSVSQWADSCVWLENKSIPRRWSHTYHKFLDANWGFSRIRTRIWEVSYLQLLIQQCMKDEAVELWTIYTLQALCCCSCTHKMVDSPLLGCTKWPPHCGADSRAVAASVRLARASVPIKDARASQTQHRIERFTHTVRSHSSRLLFYFYEPQTSMVFYLNVHFDERLPDQRRTKKSPERDQKVSACDSCQVEQRVGNLRGNRQLDQRNASCVFSVDVCRTRRIILWLFIRERIEISLCGTHRGAG